MLKLLRLSPTYESFIQASENVKLSKWGSRIEVENCSLQHFIPNGVKFDMIVTNPPYFIDSLKNPNPVKSNTRHNDNLTHSDILEAADRLLDQNGILQLIMPYDEGNIFIAEACGYGLFCNNILKIRSTPSSEIRRLILGFSREKGKPEEQFLTIEKGKRHDFTDDYVSLTKDFYLNF